MKIKTDIKSGGKGFPSGGIVLSIIGGLLSPKA